MNSKLFWLTGGVIIGATGMIPFAHLHSKLGTDQPSDSKTLISPVTVMVPKTVTEPKLFSTNNSPALALYASIAACEASDFLTMAKKILAMPASSVRQAALDLLVERWTDADFETALTFANRLTGDDRAQCFKSALLQLGRSRFAEALAWIDANFHLPVRNEGELWLYCGLAQKDPQGALNRLLQIPGTTNPDIIYSILSQWAETDVYAAFAWLKAAPRNGRTIDACQRLMQIYIAQHPEDALDFVSQNVTDDFWKNRYIKAIVEKISETDPQKALTIADSLTASSDRSNAYGAIFNQWSAQNPAEALNQALKKDSDSDLSDPTKNDIVRTSAFGLLNQDRDQLVEKYKDLPQDIRMEIVGPMMSQWMAENPSTAMDWAEHLNHESPEYNLAISGAVMAYSQTDPEKAISLARGMNDENIKADDVYLALQNLYRQNPQRAVSLAADPSLVPTAICNSFKQWINESGKKEYSFYSN